jgi:MFS family permease
MYLSWYVLFPVLLPVMTGRLGLYPHLGGVVCLLLIGAMLVMGPFYSYLLDTYRRKYMYMFVLVVMASIAFSYGIVNNEAELWMLCLAQGMAFGAGAMGIVTLGIDLTVSTKRSVSCAAFSWWARFGMLGGVVLGTVLYLQYNFETVILVTVVLEMVCLVVILTVHVPFRAPIGVKVFSLDRFFLFRGWLPLLNLIFVAFVPGLFIIPSMSHIRMCDFMGYEMAVPYFAMTGMGFLFSVLLIRFIRNREDVVYIPAITGLLLVFIAILLPVFFAANSVWFFSYLLLGIGLGFVSPTFLTMFVMLSKHCERGTGNVTHLLGWETGILSGIGTSCYLAANELQWMVLDIGLFFSALASFLFFSATYPYFKKKKVR